MKTQQKVYLSLGSNVGNRCANLQKAILKIQLKIGNVLKIASVYENPAIGFEGDDFLNTCILVSTNLNPEMVLQSILEIELKLGRKRNETKGYQARTIDIDMLYYENEVIEMPSLSVPHKQLHKRGFVLVPLDEIAPKKTHPTLQKNTSALLETCLDKSSITKTTDKLATNRAKLFSKIQFLAIEGNIGAGKTTLATKIAEDYNAKLILERFADNPFLPKFYNDQQRYAFPLEMSFLADRYQQFTEDTMQFDLFKSFMISDYDIFKSLIFARITLPKDEFKLYQKIFNFMYNEVKKPDLYIYLHQNLERLLANIKKRGRSYESSIQTSYLEKISHGYLDFIKNTPTQKTLLIDISELDFVARKADYELLLSTIENEITELIF